MWETHSQTIRSDNWRDFRKKCLFQCGGPAGIRTQISGFTDRCSTVELQNQGLGAAEFLAVAVLVRRLQGRSLDVLRGIDYHGLALLLMEPSCCAALRMSPALNGPATLEWRTLG